MLRCMYVRVHLRRELALVVHSMAAADDSAQVTKQDEVLSGVSPPLSGFSRSPSADGGNQQDEGHRSGSTAVPSLKPGRLRHFPVQSLNECIGAVCEYVCHSPKINSPWKGMAFFTQKHLRRSWSQVFSSGENSKRQQRRSGKQLFSGLSHVLICCKMCGRKRREGKQKPTLGQMVRDEGENFQPRAWYLLTQ